MHFAHISDLHLCRDPENNAAVKNNTIEIVEAIGHDLHRISEILDFIILSGDLTDDAHPDSFQQFERIFSRLGTPVFVVPGNHDGPSAFFQCKADRGFLSQSDISGRVVDLGDVRLLGLNTCVENETTGAIAAIELDVLERELELGGGSQLVVVMHHPPFDPGLREFDEIAHLDGSAELGRLLQGSNTSPIILCGHVHRPYYARWHGAACFVAGSPAAPFTADLPFGNTPIYPSDAQYFYFVHSLHGAGHHVVTAQHIPCDPASTQAEG